VERKPTILICLQNAYAKGSLIRGWHPSRWWQEFLTSRSGKRLQLILPEDVKVHYCNVAPGIGESVATVLEASYSHVKKALNRTQPDYVIACGKLAEPVLIQIWKGNLLCIPHPASRVLTNQLLLKTKELLTCLIAYDFYDLLNENCYPYQEYLPYVIRLALRQRRGSVEIEELHRINPEDEDEYLHILEEVVDQAGEIQNFLGRVEAALDEFENGDCVEDYSGIAKTWVPPLVKMLQEYIDVANDELRNI